MNPKGVAGGRKVGLRYVPISPLLQVAVAMKEGAEKYGAFNWRTGPPIHFSTYFDAMERHLLEWWTGSDVDKDSGLHPLVKVMATCLVVLDSLERAVDDRPKKPLDWSSLHQAWIRAGGANAEPTQAGAG